MNNGKNIIIFSALGILGLILILAVVSSSMAVSHGYKLHISEISFGGRAELRNIIEIPVEDIDSLDISYRSKNLKIYNGAEDKVVIKEYLATSKEEAHAKVKIEDRKAQVSDGNDTVFVIFGFSMEERIEIYLPKEGLQYLTLSTKSGNISTEQNYQGNYEWMALAAGSGNIKWSNTNANASVAAGSGNLKLKNITGNVEAATGSGNIEIDDMTGSLNAGAGSGNISVEGITGEATVETHSGNAKVSVDKLTGDLRAQAGSGNVKIALPEETEGAVKIDTGSGSIHTNFDEFLSFNKDGDRAEGKLGNSAEYSISAETGSGSVYMELE